MTDVTILSLGHPYMTSSDRPDRQIVTLDLFWVDDSSTWWSNSYFSLFFFIPFYFCILLEKYHSYIPCMKIRSDTMKQWNSNLMIPDFPIDIRIRIDKKFCFFLTLLIFFPVCLSQFCWPSQQGKELAKSGSNKKNQFC